LFKGSQQVWSNDVIRLIYASSCVVWKLYRLCSSMV